MNSPSADDVARAIIAAALETLADPEEIACRAKGNRYHPEILRGRAYAAWALFSVFPNCSKTSIARMVGANGAESYLSTLDEQMRRGFLSWWVDDAFQRVVDAIRAGLPPKPATPPAEGRDDAADPEPPEPPPYRPPPPLVKTRPRQASGTLEPTGYRPPVGTIAAVLRDELDARPVMDRAGKFAAEKPYEAPKRSSKATLEDILREAVQNTAKMAPPPENS